MLCPRSRIFRLAPPRLTATRVRVVLVIATVLFLFATSAWTLYDSRLAAGRQAAQQEYNIALAIEGEVTRAINAFDLSLQAAVQGAATPGLAAMEPSIRQAILFNGAIAVQGSGGVFIADEQGRVIYDSLTTPPRNINIFDRAYFQAHLRGSDRGLVISRPIRSRADGAWALGLARRINHPDGSFAGVAVAGLKLGFFQLLFDKFDIGKKGVINLITADGVMVARRPFLEQDIGRDMSNSLMFAHLSHAPYGAFEATATVDGVRRLYSYRKLENLPFIVGVGLPDAEIYADWSRKTAILCSVLLLLGLIGSSLGWALWREFGRRGRAEADALQSRQSYAAALARLDTLFENSVDMMVVARLEADGSFVYDAVNPVWEDIAGLSAADAIGRGPEACLPPELAGQVRQAWQDSVRSRQPIRLAFSTNRYDHRRNWEAMIAPVLSEDGSITRLIAVARDMTDRQRLEEGLRQAQRMEAVGQLTAGVAHDFNNLLQGIQGALDLVNDNQKLEAETRDMLDVARNAASRGAMLVHRLLAFSRKQTLAPAVLRPEQLVAQLSQLISRVLGGHIRFETRVEDEPWPVCADDAQLQNCLLNLAINARDAIKAGGTIRLQVSNVRVEQPVSAHLCVGDYTCFAVEDDGEGMSQDTLDRVFEPFFTTKEIGKGTGLGLPMVQGFARQSGGEVSITSIPGKGTCVSLLLPRYGDGMAVDTSEQNPARDQITGRGHVLIVDDEETVRVTLKEFLVKAGYSVRVASDGLQALSYLRAADRYDLLISDQSMPGLTGSELIDQVARLRPDLPTMLITGFDKVTGLDSLVGRVTVLRKPFRRDVFLRQVQALLGAVAVSMSLAAARYAEPGRGGVAVTDPACRPGWPG